MSGTDAAGLFARVWEGGGGIPLVAARHVLKLGFGEADVARMRELAERNREGKLTDEEREELDNFVRVGDLLALLQSKARKVLQGRGRANQLLPGGRPVGSV